MATRHKLFGERVDNPSGNQIRKALKLSRTIEGFKMKPGYLYTVVRAISARVNQNYDGWPSDELKKSYHTFVGKPVFVNHENYDPAKARGVVVAARYKENGNDKYVEVVQEIDAQRFPKLANEIRTGGLDSVSMGAEAGFTICSYCGNKAFDVPDMCEHVLWHKGEKLSRFNRRTGRREEILVYESCHKLSFFELSYVFDPADETAVASKVLVAAKQHTATDCPPGKDCTIHPQSEQITPDSANNPLNGGGSSGSASGASAGSDLGKPAAQGGPAVNPGGGGVPLTQKPDGSWTSTDPAWAHLIDRESGGQNIKQSPSTQDVNSGGNEAFGLFQITPGTWSSHGGQGSVYDSTPQQQADVAAQILKSNPSGSDWGAGMAGREDAAALANGLNSRQQQQPKAASFETRVLLAAGMFNDSEGRYQGPMKSKTSYPPDPYGGSDTCPECGQHFSQGHAPGCSKASKWGKVADKCHYCAGDAEEGRNSCTAHSKMEDNKFTKKVLEAAGFRQATHPGADQGWSYDQDADTYNHPSGHVLSPSDEQPGTHQLWAPTVVMRGPHGLAKDRAPHSDLQKHFDWVDKTSAVKAADYMGDFYGEPTPNRRTPKHWSDLMYDEVNPHDTSGPEDQVGAAWEGARVGRRFKKANSSVPGGAPEHPPGTPPEHYVVPFEGRGYTPGSPVEAYRNLNSEKTGTGIWSFKDPRSGLVVGHSHSAHVPGGEMFVRQGGQEKVLETGKKNVHAGVRGVLGPVPEQPLEGASGITYNPKAGDTSFTHRDDGTPVTSTSHVHLGPDGRAYAFDHSGSNFGRGGRPLVGIPADHPLPPHYNDGGPGVMAKKSFETRVLEAAGMHRMPEHPGRHEPGPDYDPRVPPEGYQVYDAHDWLNRPQEFEARVVDAFRKGAPFADYEDFADCESKNKDKGDTGAYCGEIKHRTEDKKGSFQARVMRAWGETEAPASVDTLREEGSAPEDDNNDFYHYVEPPKELQTPDLSEATQIDREQDEQGIDTDGAPGPSSMDAGPQPQQPQQQYMELKIPIPQQGQAGAGGAPSIPMQPYQDQPPQQPPAGPPPGPPGPPPGPPQQLAASTLAYFDRYFGHRVGREMNLQTLENGAAGFTKSRNPRKGTANMARSTLAERGKVVTAGRRQHFAEGPLVDTGDQSRNDQGEQEEVFITQTPPAEPVDAPTDDTPNISNTENNLVAKVRRGRDQLLRDAQALANHRAKQGKRRTAGDQDEAGGPVATEVDPQVNTGPAGEELTGDDFESADPNADVQETQPKDASLHAFKQFDRWLASKTGRPSRQHTSATIRRAADDYSRSAGISVQAMFPALGIVLREARKNETNTKGAKNMRKRAVDLEVAAPDGRVDVEAPTEDTTDAEAQASQFDLNDFGNNAGDNIADPDLSTDQNWAPGEAKTGKKVKTAGGILAFRCAEAMIAAGLEPNTVERKYALAGEFENMNRGLIQSATTLCERFAGVLQNERRKVASGSTRGAALKSPVPSGLTQGAQRTAATSRVAANDPRNDSTMFV